MRDNRHFWIIILAAGEGQRVRALTRLVPKQFCTLDGHQTMLRWAVDRALRLVPAERVVAVVADQHRQYWRTDLRDLPERNVVVQPANRGTASGILLPFTEVLRRDPGARVLVLPSDQFVLDEELLSAELEAGARCVASHPDRIVLFGMCPNRFESGYGWIVPGAPVPGERVRSVDLFLDGPDDRIARRLMRQGGLLDSLMFSANAATLLRLYEAMEAEMTEQFLRLDDEGPDYQHALRALYHVLPEADFRRDILTRASEDLTVLSVEDCGWTDLSTPGRMKYFRCRDHLHPESPAGPPGSWFG